MKRRDFLFHGALLLLAFKFMKKAMAKPKITWALPGKFNYSHQAPASAKKFGKSCSTCKFLFRDAKIKGASLCSNPLIQKVARASEVYVKEVGYCDLWQKDG